MTNKILIPEQEVTDRLNRAKQAVDRINGKYVQADNDRKEFGQLIHFLNTDNNYKIAQISDLEQDYVIVEAAADFAIEANVELQKKLGVVSAENLGYETVQAKLVGVIQGKSAEIVGLKRNNDVKELEIDFLYDENTRCIGAVLEAETSCYDANQANNRLEDIQGKLVGMIQKKSADVRTVKTDCKQKAGQIADLQADVYDAELKLGAETEKFKVIVGGAEVRAANYLADYERLEREKAKVDAHLVYARKNLRNERAVSGLLENKLGVVEDQLCDKEADICDAELKNAQYAAKTKRAGRIVASMNDCINDLQADVCDAEERCIDGELNNLVLAQKNQDLQLRAETLDTAADIVMGANVELQGKLYSADCKITDLDKRVSAQKETIKRKNKANKKLNDANADLTKSFSADEADIARLETGYAALEAEKDAVKARYERFEDAHLQACKTVDDKNARISELETAVGRRDGKISALFGEMVSLESQVVACGRTPVTQNSNVPELYAALKNAYSRFTNGSRSEIENSARNSAEIACEKGLQADYAVGLVQTLASCGSFSKSVLSKVPLLGGLAKQERAASVATIFGVVVDSVDEHTDLIELSSRLESGISKKFGFEYAVTFASG